MAELRRPIRASIEYPKLGNLLSNHLLRTETVDKISSECCPHEAPRLPKPPLTVQTQTSDRGRPGHPLSPDQNAADVGIDFESLSKHSVLHK